MPDLTTASAMFLIMSSLTLQPNLFQEFHPMGGVRARFADGDALSCCAPELATSSSAQKHRTKIRRFIFMQTFYQNQARIGTGKMKAEGRRVRVKIDLQCRIARSCQFRATFGGGTVRRFLNSFFVTMACGVAFLLGGSHLRAQTPQPVGIFEDHADLG